MLRGRIVQMLYYGSISVSSKLQKALNYIYLTLPFRALRLFCGNRLSQPQEGIIRIKHLTICASLPCSGQTFSQLDDRSCLKNGLVNE
jgi:hypothetical protein